MSYIGQGTNGQVPIAATGDTAKFATLTSTGGTIKFTAGANSLNLEVAGSGESWVEVTGTTQSMSPNFGYIANNAGLVTLSLPTILASTAAGIGATITVMGKGAGGWKIDQNATQQIRFGSSATTVSTGSLASTDQYDVVTLVLIDAAGAIWSVKETIGNLTVV